MYEIVEDSLSSNSPKRFLENFQMKKAMIPITAIPPATDMPMMEPTERPLEVGGGGGAWVALAVELSDEDVPVPVLV